METLAELTAVYQGLEQQIKSLKERQRECLNRALPNAKYSIGERIKYQHGHSKECEIVNIHASAGYKNEIGIEYSYAPVKKDGTRGLTASWKLSEETVSKYLIEQ